MVLPACFIILVELVAGEYSSRWSAREFFHASLKAVIFARSAQKPWMVGH